MLISLPYPPSVNTYWRHNRGRTHISIKGKVYRQAVIWAFQMKRPRPEKLAGRLELTLTLTMPDKRRRDLDNVLKSLLDSLEHAGAYFDDSQIDVLHVYRAGIKSPGKCEVLITERGAISHFDAQTASKMARSGEFEKLRTENP